MTDTGDFLKPEQPVYEDIVSFSELKRHMENQLEDYNMEPGVIPMELVLFRDAIEHGMYEVFMVSKGKGWRWNTEIQNRPSTSTEFSK